MPGPVEDNLPRLGLERLRLGPATNAELAQLALKYTSRISDIRAAGYVVDKVRREGGTVTYALR